MNASTAVGTRTENAPRVGGAHDNENRVRARRVLLGRPRRDRSSRREALLRKPLGWQCVDMPAGPGMTYTMCSLKNQYVSALYALDKERQSQGVPPHWLPYINVRNADASAKKASQGGGKVLNGPFDVLDVGRMAGIQDPTGAYFAIWEAKKHIGGGIIGGPGAMCW